MKFSRFRTVLTVILILGLGGMARAASDGGVTVRSDRLQVQEKTGDIRFEGNVEVRVSDVVLNCDLLVVQAEESDRATIRSGEATGNVVLVRGADRIEAMQAAFDLLTGHVELSGEPRLIREDATIQAETIVYSIEEGTASFNGPVRALFKAPGEGS